MHDGCFTPRDYNLFSRGGAYQQIFHLRLRLGEIETSHE